MASKNEQISLQPLNQSSTSTKASSSIRIPENDGINTDKDDDNSAAGGQQVTRKGKNREGGKNIEDIKEFKTRAMLEKELVDKSQRLCLLEQQMKEQEDSFRDKQSQEDSSKKLYEATRIELAKAQGELTNFADLKEKNAVLSEENCKLRETLTQKDEEIKRLGEAKELGNSRLENESPIQKILRKENVELHHEKEQLKIERDRLRHSLKEKQIHMEKMNVSTGELQDQLFQAKRSLEERSKASALLEDRLANIDEELCKYRERLATQDKDNETIPGQRNRNENVGGMATLEDEKELRNKRHITLLQRKEEKLLEDRSQLERKVNALNNKIKHMEGQLRNCRTEKRPTNERSSQTELGTGANKAAKLKQWQSAGSTLEKESLSEGTTIRKCKGIVTSLGKFFEELIQNNEESPRGSSKGRRTAIAARRANELLHELSISIEYFVSQKHNKRDEGSGNVSGCTKYGPHAPSGGRRSDANTKGTLWDKVNHELAHHEFTFEQNIEDVGDKDNEVKRAEKGLHKLYQAGSSTPNETLVREDVSRKIDVNSKQTEKMVRELLHKHHDEIKTLVEKACISSPAVTSVSYDRNSEGSGHDEASLVVKELDNFKTRTAKVQSLVLKMQAFIEGSKNERENVNCQLQALENELRQKEALLQAKTQELRRRHCRTLDTEKASQAQIESLREEKTRACSEIARLHDVCRHKDLQIVEKVQEVKALQAEIAERERTHKEKLNKMKQRVEEAWNEYASVKMRAEKRTAEFNDAAEKLKVSQGYLLDLWQTLKTVDNVVETNENEDL